MANPKVYENQSVFRYINLTTFFALLFMSPYGISQVQSCPSGTIPNVSAGTKQCTKNGQPNVCQVRQTNGGALPIESVADIAHAHNFKCDGLVNAIAEAVAESTLHPAEVDLNLDKDSLRICSTDKGLWQINDIAWTRQDWINNLGAQASNCGNDCGLIPDLAAVLVSHITHGGTDTNAWSKYWSNTFGRQAFNKALTDARTAAARVSQADNCGSQVPQPPATTPPTQATIEIITSGDPNEKVGSTGGGLAQYIQGSTSLRYAIFFSNKETASAAAQDVSVIDQLDLKNDDLKSFSLGPIGFGTQLVTPPAGVRSFSSTVDLRPANNLLVKVDATLNLSSGLLAWHFTSLDPATNQPPLDPTAGFLPPGGEGSVFFTVMPNESLATDTAIKNQATIVFDVNAPISTQTWINTIDNDKPSSHVLALPAQSPANIPLQWTGTDLGAGVQDFTIFVSDNSGPFSPFLTNTPSTSITFPGQAGHSYAFFSVARDLVGNVEDTKTAAEATTTVPADAIPPSSMALLSPSPNTNGWNNTNVTATITATDNPGGSGVQQITFSATGGQPIPSTNVSGSLASTTISNEGITNLNFFSSDLAGNVESAHTLPIRIDKTPPSITGARNPGANANGWNNTDVSVSFACTDALSGLAPGSPPPNTVLTSEGANQQVSGTCFALAGNSASATVSGINIDKTPPVLSGLPVAGCTLWPPDHKFVTVATISGSDAFSGLASLNVTGTSSEPMDPNNPDIIISGTGTQPRTVQLRAERLGTGSGRVYTINTVATDAAGNTVNASSTCTVPHDQGQ